MLGRFAGDCCLIAQSHIRMTFTCPRCQMVLNAEPELAGKITHCPACASRIRVPLASQMGAAPATQMSGATRPQPSTSKGKSWQDSDPANINPWLPLSVGVGATVLALLLLGLFKSTFIGQVVFVGTGEWVNFAEILLFFWGLAIVLVKWRKSERQRSALMLDVLPQALGREITPEGVEGFLLHIDSLPLRVRESLMVKRIRKGLELFQVRRSNGEVASMLSTLSDVDANRMAGSYSIVKVFLWAIPILGFIGTVLGLSYAMASFGGTDLTDMAALKTSVRSITGGLATAFNTTLLGLILSMILMFPMSAVQKREEDCLTEIDAFCNEHLLPRLNDGSQGAAALSAENPAGFLENVAQQLADQQNQFLTALNATAETMRAVLDGLGQQATSHYSQISESLTNATAEVAKRASQSVEQSVQFSGKYFAALEAGVKSLNEVLKSLGEKQIVIQQVKRRGLFSKG